MNAYLTFGLLSVAVSLFAVSANSTIDSPPPAPGLRLVAQYKMPQQEIARYAALAAGKAHEGPQRTNSLFADRAPWVGPQRQVGVGANPYTLVYVVSGVARTAGEVQAQWQTGWEIQESATARREVMVSPAANARSGLAAGEAVTFTATSGRLSFRGERRAAPMLGVVQTRNLDIAEVELQVWSGAALPGWPPLPLPLPALLALMALGLLLSLVFRRRQRRALVF